MDDIELNLGGLAQGGKLILTIYHYTGYWFKIEEKKQDEIIQIQSHVDRLYWLSLNHFLGLEFMFGAKRFTRCDAAHR